MTVEAIKEGILALPEKEQLAIESWLADRWDEQIERDFQPGGRGEKLLAEVDADINAGKFGPMEFPKRD